MRLEQLQSATLEWSHNKGIIQNSTPQIQALKLVSEVGELCDNLAKNKDVRDDIGDCIVVLTNLAAMTGTTLEECWNVAYDDIKDRKGFINKPGTFIKNTDVGYEQLYMEFQEANDE